MDAMTSGGFTSAANSSGYFPSTQSVSSDALAPVRFSWSHTLPASYDSRTSKDSAPRDFSDLAERIEKALSRNPYVPKRRLRIETHAGRVVIRGVVQSYFQKQMVQETLRKVEGIEEICNEVEVATR